MTKKQHFLLIENLNLLDISKIGTFRDLYLIPCGRSQNCLSVGIQYTFGPCGALLQIAFEAKNPSICTNNLKLIIYHNSSLLPQPCKLRCQTLYFYPAGHGFVSQEDHISFFTFSLLILLSFCSIFCKKCTHNSLRSFSNFYTPKDVQPFGSTFLLLT